MGSVDTHDHGDEIAIIGMTCRFPGAKNIDQFWQNLYDGVESISSFSDEELLASGVPPSLMRNSNYIKAKGILEQIELFDALFFGFSPREAEMIDPQHRLFLECAWEALEHAGYDPAIYKGRIGVYAGVGMNTYLLTNLYSNQDMLEHVGYFQTELSNDKDYLATRVSYKLNLRGPSITVQTACSTSLVAVHLACQSLLSGDCDLALAGGSSVSLPQKAGFFYEEGGILSPDGHCRAFDAAARGTTFGDGVGIVVLKRLENALADGDFVHAMIKGSAINNDGADKVGYTAPSVHGQAAVIAEALAIARVAPETIGYIEAHGTGTPLGDPIEVAALTQVFRAGTDRTGFCAIGSVKTNVGHLNTAAGIAGLIKTILALKHRQIPPSLHFRSPNPKIDFAASPFYVASGLLDWQAGPTPRRAGVSSFGIGGTNAHVVLEEAPAVISTQPSRPWQLLVLSAKTSTALEAATINLAAELERRLDLPIADVAYTLQAGRHAFSHRRMLACRDRDDALAALKQRDPARLVSRFQERQERSVVFLFSGQGAQYVNMTLGLYQHEPVFRAHVDQCAELLKPQLGLDLREIIFDTSSTGTIYRAPTTDAADSSFVVRRSSDLESALDQTQYAQPALFVAEYALARLWMTWGVRPVSMIGHSIGEYVAACLAGVFSLEDALALVTARGRLMQNLPPGVMLAVSLSAQDVQPLLEPQIDLAASNGPARCVVSGPAGAIETLERELTRRVIDHRRMRTSHAFHSAMMEPILAPFLAQVQRVRLKSPTIPYVSNLTGTWISPSEALDPRYWVQHLRQPVRFSEGLRTLLAEPNRVLLEVGPGQSLSSLARQHLAPTDQQDVFASVRHPHDQQTDLAYLLTTLGKLWLAGVQVDWESFSARDRHRRLPLPTYPFERQRCWIEARPQEQVAVPRPARPATAKTLDLADWFYMQSWTRSMPPTKALAVPAESGVCWLLFSTPAGIGLQLARALAAAGQDVAEARIGTNFGVDAACVYTIDAGRRDDYVALLADLRRKGKRPGWIVHLWSITSQPESNAAAGAQALGFYSLTFLAQALGEQSIGEPLDLWVVSNNLYDVTGADTVCPEKATMLGPCKVIPQEYPNVTCRFVDIIAPAPGTPHERRVVEQLLDEFQAGLADTLIAYRGLYRWVQTFTRIALDGASQPPVRDGGVYLITGGLGGIGLVLAEELARTARARLILVGRSPFPAPEEWERRLAQPSDRAANTIRTLQAIKALGAEVLIANADVTDREQMEGVITRARAHFGDIHGVIHAAGIPGGGVIQLKTTDSAARVLAPKVQGALVLCDLLRDAPLDFLLLCSSITAITGGFGQVDYCAANAFLDALAYANSAQTGIRTIAINWDVWQEVGMAVNTAMPRWLRENRHIVRHEGAQHPLLDACIVASVDRQVYLTEFSVTKHWVLNEHKITGKALIAGTTYLEMARAAYEKHIKSGMLEISEVFFITPLVVEDEEPKEVLTILEKSGDGFVFRIKSRYDADSSAKPGWQEHARGKIRSASLYSPKQHDIAAIIGTCDVDSWENAAEMNEGGMADVIYFGPRWHSLKKIYANESHILALLELHEDFAADLDQIKLHPALLDVATGPAVPSLDRGGYLPLSYKNIKVSAALPRKIYSYIQRDKGDFKGETATFNITIMDENGLELLDIEEFTMRRIDDTSAKSQEIAEKRLRSAPRRTLSEGISPKEGVEVFRRILSSCRLPQIVVSTRSLQDVIAQVNALNQSRILAETEAAWISDQRHPRPDLATPYVVPRNELERRLAEIWQNVLGIEQVGIHDNFFELGGDSVMGIQVIAKATSANLQITPAQLFQHQTIAGLATVVGLTPSIQAAQILQKVKGMSPEEVKAMLAAKRR
jgi:acyl transferase domain-containing protein